MVPVKKCMDLANWEKLEVNALIDTAVGTTVEAMTASAVRLAIQKSWTALQNRCSVGHSSVDILKYSESCYRQLHIKTLASAIHNTSVHVDDLYVPLTLNGVTDISIIVADRTLIEHGDRLVIIRGFAGRGKSTILRKLLSNHLKHQPSTFPIFYELKYYKGGDIESALSAALNIGGAALHKKNIESLLQDSSTKLFLDAFDEVSPKLHSELVEQIEKLRNKYNCKVICTTRPDTEFDTVTDVTTYSVAELNDPEIKAIIRKTTDDEQKSSQLCAALDTSKLHSSSESILKSPILVVLFCVSYNMGQDIPDSLGEFYDNIFDAVFSRHDNLKGQVNRERIRNDNRGLYRLIFDTISFLTLQDNVQTFTEQELITAVRNALDYHGEKADDSDRISFELRSITNLIIQDGYNSFRYVHKSIQEFFASSFVKSLKQSKRVDFYIKCVRDNNFFTRFGNTLFFLEEIDYYNYVEYYLIPATQKMLGIESEISDAYRPSDSVVRLFLSNMVVGVQITHYSLRKGGAKRSYEVSGPHFENREDYPGLLANLYYTAFELLRAKLGAYEQKLRQIVTKSGAEYEVEDGVWSIPLSKIMECMFIDEEHAFESFTLAVGLHVAPKYNSALAKLSQRTYANESSGLLKF